jgi:serine protease
MNTTCPATLRPLQTIALTIAIASAMTACKREAATPPQPVVETTEPAMPVPPPAPAEPPSHNLKPATDVVEANDETIAATRKQLKDLAAAAREKWRGKTFDEFEASVFKEPGEDGKYIVNGDVAIADRKLLQEFFDNMLRATNGTANGKLALAVIGNGVDAVWTSDKKKQLTYCISDSFGARKASVDADIAAATGDWEQIANVDFIHVAAQDANCNADNTNVEFDVRPIDVDGEYLALSSPTIAAATATS